MAKEKKIIIVGPAWPYRGGIADFDERLAREFSGQGHDASIVSYTLQYPEFLFPGKTQFSADRDHGLPVKRLLNSCNPISWIRTGKALKKENADIIIFAFWMPFFGPALGTVARIARRSGAKCIGLMHNVLPHDKKPGDRIFTKYFVRAMDSFVAMSDSVLSDISLFDTRKPRVMHPHPLYDHFGQPVSREEACSKLGLDTNRRYFLFFGLIRAYKGLDLLLEALCDKRFRSNDTFKLIVAGEFYGDGSKYTDFVESNGLKDKVIWMSEFIPTDKVKYCFCAADIIVQPYKSATQSGVAQIAYNFDKPLLVSDVGGLGETVPDGKAGYVVPPEPGAIADAMADFMEKRPDFSEGIREVKARYSWKGMADAILDM